MRYEPHWMSDNEIHAMLTESRDEQTADNWLECLDGLRWIEDPNSRCAEANKFLEYEKFFIRVVDVKTEKDKSGEDEFYWNVLFIDHVYVY